MPLRQDDAVDAVLQAVVLAADVELAEGILRDVGRLQETWLSSVLSPPGVASIALASKV